MIKKQKLLVLLKQYQRKLNQSDEKTLLKIIKDVNSGKKTIDILVKKLSYISGVRPRYSGEIEELINDDYRDKKGKITTDLQQIQDMIITAGQYRQ